MLLTTYILVSAIIAYLLSLVIKKSKPSLILTIIAELLFFAAISIQGISGGPSTAVMVMLYICGFIIALQLLKSILILIRGGNTVELKDGMMIINSKFRRREFDVKRIVHADYKIFLKGMMETYIITLNNGSVTDIPNKGLSEEIKEILDSKLEKK
jgi:hypothetical protein